MKKKRLSKRISLSKETVSRLNDFSSAAIKGGRAGNDNTATPCNTIGACETDGQNYCFPGETNGCGTMVFLCGTNGCASGILTC